jgi:hypothetical protein
VSTYPVTFEADYVEQRSRLTTFFRLLLAIPHYILMYLWGIGVFFAVVIAWFALLFTGKWPAGLYDFTTGFLRYFTRVNAYTWLLVDEYPPFSGGEEAGYPARLHVGPPLAEYDRLKVGLRFFYAIPAMLIVYVMNIVLELAAVASWFVIVITGRQPKGLQDVIALGVSYVSRANALFALVTETYPPFNDDQSAQIGQPAAATPLPQQPAPVAPEVPVQETPAPQTHGFDPPAAPPPAAPTPEPPAEEDEPPPGPFGPSSGA